MAAGHQGVRDGRIRHVVESIQSGFLESLTGLDKLHAEGEQALEAVDWEEEGEGADEGF